jgi:DNA-binding NarL/FixJ family response regulator
MMTEKIKLFVLDDHQMMIDGIKALLKNEKQFEIVGEATRAVQALKMIAATAPDIIITDIQMPEMNGIEFTRKLKSDYPAIKVLVLSMSGEEGLISEMLDAGISGYVIKNTGREELKTALTKIAAGDVFFSEAVSAEMMRAYQSNKRRGLEDEAVNLTTREKEIIKLIAMEYSNAKIGEALHISERTVETHRKNIFRKTKTKGVVGLVKFAIEQKLI